MCRHIHNRGDQANVGQAFRLPKHVRPIRYHLQLTPGIKVTQADGSVTYKFTGRERVKLNVLQSTDRVVLHAANLEIHEAYVENKRGKRLNGTVTLDPKNEFAIITFDQKVEKGKWTLYCRFTGIHNTKLKGFYLSQWDDAEGQKHQIFTTQFESTDARQAFPCFDEPAMKAEFDVELIVDEHLSALSNGRAIKTESLGDGRKIVTYARTPKMSTYLVAFVVGELESSEPVWSNGKEIRVWSIPGKNHLKSFALKVAKFGVAWFEEFNDRPYFGGDKIDMVAIPDFASGAMENTGLITYRDTALLVDEAKASFAELMRVCEVVLHELDHQWNGNEVTMDDWDGLGLNESFATIMAFISMNAMYPEWHVYNEFGLDRAGAFALDSLKTTHPVAMPVSHPDDIQQFFDQITYEKGGSLLFQIIQYMGFETFRDGMRIYMRRHALGNAKVVQLWDALEEGAKAHANTTPVRSIMDAWWNTPGHPIVTVEEGTEPGSVRFTQKKFQFIPEEGAAEVLWPIPMHVRYKLKDGTVKEDRVLFSEREMTLNVGEGFQWFVVNAGGPGFYRVRYSQTLQDKLTADVFGTLEIIERFNLVNDSWAAVRARLMPADQFMGLVGKFAGETDPSVWSIVGGALRTLYGLTKDAERLAFKQTIRELVRPVFDKLGWHPAAGESVHTLQLRGQLAGLLGTIGSDPDIRAAAPGLFDQWKADRNAVDPNVVPALIGILAHTGDGARFEEYIELAGKAPTTQEKLRFLGALGAFRDPGLFNRAISMMLSESIRTQDAPFLLAGIIGTEHAGEAAWDWMRENWEKLVEAYPDNAIPRMVSSCSALDTNELEAEVLEFFATHKVKEGDMAVAQMLERLRVNVTLREEETPRLSAFLAPAAAAFKTPVSKA